MILTSRPTASSSGRVGEVVGPGVVLGVGHPAVAVPEHLQRRVPEHAHALGEFGHPQLVHRLGRTRVLDRGVQDVARFAAGAADEHVVHALGRVLRRGAGTLRGFVVGVGVDLEEAQTFGGHPLHATCCV